MRKIPACHPKGDAIQEARFGTYLYDLGNAFQQLFPMQNPAVEDRIIKLLTRFMAETPAPREQHERLRLSPPSESGDGGPSAED